MNDIGYVVSQILHSYWPYSGPSEVERLQPFEWQVTVLVSRLGASTWGWYRRNFRKRGEHLVIMLAQKWCASSQD